MTPEDFCSAAQRACHRADVRMEHWSFDGNEMHLQVSSEHGLHEFASTGLRNKVTVETFEEIIYRSVLDWTT